MTKLDELKYKMKGMRKGLHDLDKSDNLQKEIVANNYTPTVDDNTVATAS